MISILAFDFPQLIHSSVEQAELDPSEKVVGANKRQESLRKYIGLAHTLQEPQACSEGQGGEGGRSGCLRHCGSVGAKMGQKTICFVGLSAPSWSSILSQPLLRQGDFGIQCLCYMVLGPGGRS